VAQSKVGAVAQFGVGGSSLASASRSVAVLYQIEGNRVPDNLRSKMSCCRVYGSRPYVQRVGATDNDEILPIAYNRMAEGIRAAWPDEIVHG
jgi:hypothetical protein